MTDPNMPPESPLVAGLVCLLLLVGVPCGIWVAMTWTKQRWAAAWQSLKHPVSHDARTYQVCFVHGLRIPLNGDCADCVQELHAELDALEWGE